MLYNAFQKQIVSAKEEMNKDMLMEAMWNSQAYIYMAYSSQIRQGLESLGENAWKQVEVKVRKYVITFPNLIAILGVH